MKQTEQFDQVAKKGKEPIIVPVVKIPLSGVRKWFAWLFGRRA